MLKTLPGMPKVCMYVCMCVRICMHVCKHSEDIARDAQGTESMHVYVCVRIYVYVYVYACMYMQTL